MQKASMTNLWLEAADEKVDMSNGAWRKVRNLSDAKLLEGIIIQTVRERTHNMCTHTHHITMSDDVC